MFKFASLLSVFAGAASAISHLDNTDGRFDTFDFDSVKFKTRTNCSLDKYPEVSCFAICTSYLSLISEGYQVRETVTVINTNAFASAFYRSEPGWIVTPHNSLRHPSWWPLMACHASSFTKTRS